MKAMRSVDRFLTTHTGSLPRPDDLVELVIATQRGDDVDPVALENHITSAVQEATRRQVEAGIDIVNDGEMSQPSYATYVLSGSPVSAARSNSFPFADLKDFPVARASPAIPAVNTGARPAAMRRSRWRISMPAKHDMDRLSAAAKDAGRAWHLSPRRRRRV